jgi:hypothetical protein
MPEHHAHVVLGEEHGDFLAARERCGELHQCPALLRRHACRRLIHQQQAWPVGKRNGELDALEVAVREHRAGAAGLLAHAYALEEALRFRNAMP